VRIADRFAGRLSESPYLGRYDRLATPWHMAAGTVDGEPAILVFDSASDLRTPRSVIRIAVVAGKVVRVADYGHCPWVLRAARELSVTND